MVHAVRKQTQECSRAAVRRRPTSSRLGTALNRVLDFTRTPWLGTRVLKTSPVRSKASEELW